MIPEPSGSDWVLPAARNKIGVDLVRPLSAQAMAVLSSLPRLGEFVFTLSGHGQLGSVSAASARHERTRVRRRATSTRSRRPPERARACMRWNKRNFRNSARNCKLSGRLASMRSVRRAITRRTLELGRPDRSGSPGRDLNIRLRQVLLCGLLDRSDTRPPARVPKMK